MIFGFIGGIRRVFYPCGVSLEKRTIGFSLGINGLSASYFIFSGENALLNLPPYPIRCPPAGTELLFMRFLSCQRELSFDSRLGGIV